MAKPWFVLAVLGGLLALPAAAQEWSKPEIVSIPDSPLNFALTGWGKKALERVILVRGSTNDGRGSAEIYFAKAAADGYEANVIMHEAMQTVHWEQNTIQNIAASKFKNIELQFGEYFDIEYGAADFRAIPVNFTQNGKKMSCGVFRSYWRNFSTDGYLCAAAGKTLSPDAIRTFITHISYRSALTPKDEGSLPPLQ